MITKCTGFGIRMSWVQFLVQKLLIYMKSRKVIKFLYISEPLSVNGANTICLEEFLKGSEIIQGAPSIVHGTWAHPINRSRQAPQGVGEWVPGRQ